MFARNANVQIVWCHARNTRGLFHRLPNGVRGFLNVGHHATAKPHGTRTSNAHDAEHRRTRQVALHGRHEGGGVSGADVKSSDDGICVHGVRAITWS